MFLGQGSGESGVLHADFDGSGAGHASVESRRAGYRVTEREASAVKQRHRSQHFRMMKTTEMKGE